MIGDHLDGNLLIPPTTTNSSITTGTIQHTKMPPLGISVVNTIGSPTNSEKSHNSNNHSNTPPHGSFDADYLQNSQETEYSQNSTGSRSGQYPTHNNFTDNNDNQLLESLKSQRQSQYYHHHDEHHSKLYDSTTVYRNKGYHNYENDREHAQRLMNYSGGTYQKGQGDRQMICQNYGGKEKVQFR